MFTEDVVRELMGSATAVSELEKEWERLRKDREILRTIFPTGDSKVSGLPSLEMGAWWHDMSCYQKHML